MSERVVIVGSGPAAYNAALYVMEESPLMFEGGYIGNNGPGGQLTTTTAVDNYPGFPEGVEGPVLVEQMRMQCVERGLRIRGETVVEILKDDEGFVIVSDAGKYRTTAVIIATGASARRLFVRGTGDDELWQRGVSSCAVCDGFAYVGKDVCVIGGGDAAMEEALYLSNIAREVFIIHRRNEFRARDDMLERARGTENVKIVTPYVLEAVEGEDVVQRVLLKNVEDGKTKEMKMDGVFFGIGHDPNTSFLRSSGVELDEDGYVVTKDEVLTNVEGMFACGDVSDKRYRQAVTAASAGALCGMKVKRYLEGRK